VAIYEEGVSNMKNSTLVLLVLVLAIVGLSGCTSEIDLSGKRIAILIDERYLHVYVESVMDYVHKRGGETVVVALRSGTITAMDDPPRTLVVEQVTSDVDATQFDALFVPGGFSYRRLIPSAEAMEFIRVFDKNKKVIAGICAGTSVLAESGVLDGKSATGSSMPDLLRGGARYSTEAVAVDGNIVTSQSSGMVEMNKIFAEVIARGTR